MPGLMRFIGREEEVSSINNLIQHTNVRAAVFVRGSGGLGKTRLLQEIRRAYVEKEEFFVTEIIDFDERSLHTFEGLEIRIGQELSIAPEIARELQKLRNIRLEYTITSTVQEQRQNITDTIKHRLNQLAENKRVLFFFDTLEKLEENNLKRLLALLSDITNGVFLFAGRPSAESPRPKLDISQLLEDYFADEIHMIDLKPLDQEKSKEYLYAKLRALHNVRDERIQNLLPLVEGKPILIELTAQWLSIAEPPQWLLQESLSKADSQAKSQFETNLVRHIAQLRTPMDRLLLVLSRIYPFDEEMTTELLGMSGEDAAKLIENARQYVFVKTLPGAKITLHDEMRTMVDKFIWPLNDMTGERRRHDSRKAAAIFEKRINELKNKIQDEHDILLIIQYDEQRKDLIDQLVEHALYADRVKGLVVAYTTWKQAMEEKDYDLARRILEIVEPFLDQLTNDQRRDYILWTARLNNHTGRAKDSLPNLRNLARQHAEERSHLSSIYNVLGIAERLCGNITDAVRYLRRNLNIIQDTNPGSIPYVANQLGFTYRLTGNLGEAEKMYKYALKLAIEAEKHDEDLIASLLNNLGYIYGVQKKYDIAENYCSQAADIWRDIGLVEGIGRVEISLGILYRDQGNYEEAIKLFHQALERTSDTKNYELIGRAYLHLAWAKWFKWEEINKIAILDWDETKQTDTFVDRALLIEAKDDFDRSLYIAESHGEAEILLPGILRQMSNVCWWMGWLIDEKYKSQARALNTQAYEESERRQNIRYWIDSLVGEAEFDYDAGEYSRIPAYAERLQARYGRMEKEYSLYFGRIKKILGDVAFHQEQYNEALDRYTDALPKIQRHGGYGKYSTRLELLRLERKLDKLSLSEVNRWLDHFQAHWKRRSELLHWCDKEHLRAKLRAN
jgi:tetratricopeptide (TPR) repeat protein